MSATRDNPYVGPRPFTSRESLPARAQEVLELRHTLVAARILVLHSPSGAGKTSLIEAHNGLRTEMQGRGFVVRPTLRVSQPPPLELVCAVNRYELSVLRGLDDDLREPSELAALGLAGWLAAHNPSEGSDRGQGTSARDLPRSRELLLFDQFEEILTTDPTDDAGRDEFFERLAEVLEDPYRWVLFIVREDYLGALEPWARRLPTLLMNRFRIDLLDASAAREAIQRPAQGGGVRFAADALQYLVDELLQTSIQHLDGKITRREGNWVEPVHLQVVCRRLWSQLDAGATQVELAQVRELGDVDVALAGYYDEQMRAIAWALGTSERFIRDWIGARLISAQGARVPIMLGLETSDGLPNRVLEALESAHLIRGEERRKIKWYELSHDRLVPAVRRSNTVWAEQHLHPMQMQAALWDRQGRRDEMLLREDALPAAVEWAAEHASELTGVERAYLEDSRERIVEQLRERAAAERLAYEQARRYRQLLIGAVVLSLALFATILAGAYARYMARLADERGEKVEVSQRLYKRVMFDSVLSSLRGKTAAQLAGFASRYERQLAIPEGDEREARAALRFYLLVTSPKEWFEKLPIVHDKDFLMKQIQERMPVELGVARDVDELDSSRRVAEIFVSLAQDDEFDQPRDLGLVRVVRDILRRGASEEAILSRILVASEEASGMTRIGLRELVGPDIFEERNDQVSPVFTSSGWEPVMGQISASSAGLEDDWILGLDVGELAQLRQRRAVKLQALYRRRYIEAWTRMIEGMRMNPPRTLDEGIDRLDRLTRGANPPFERVFRVLQDNVTVPQGLGLFNKETGISEFDRAFTRLIDFVVPIQRGYTSDRPVDLLREAHAVLVSARDDPRRRALALDELRALILRTKLVIDHANLGEWRDDARIFLLQPLTQMLLLLDEEELLNAWCTSLVWPFAGHIEGRYPFAVKEAFEVPMIDFVASFQPRGEIRRARDELLASWLRRDGDRWIAHVGDGASPILDAGVVAFINRADEITDGMFVDGAPQLEFDVEVQCDRWQVRGVDIAVGDAEYSFECKDLAAQRIRWSGEAAGTRLFVRGASAKKELTWWGEWSLFRFMEHEGARLSIDAERIKVAFDMSPFALGALTIILTPTRGADPGRMFETLRSADLIPPRRLFDPGNPCKELGVP